jgi:hypothetical protein
VRPPILTKVEIRLQGKLAKKKTMSDNPNTTGKGDSWPKPPPPPTTIPELMEEMLGCVFGNLNLYQGTFRYWLMWRLPQLVELTRATPGLKFHYCAATPRDLYRDFIRLFLLPDLLTVGQCGPLLVHEPLFFLHDVDKTWPNVDGKHNALAGIACKPDRPIPDEMIPFLRFFFAPLAHTGRLLYAPLGTMLSGPTPETTPLETAALHLEQVMKQSSEDGLSFGGFSVKDHMIEAKAEFSKPNAPKSIPMQRPNDPPPPDFKAMERRDGRLVAPDALYPIIDPRWDARDVLAFEFYLSRCLDSMLVVGGDWAKMLPSPGYHFNIRLPYVEGIPPEALARAIAEDPTAFRAFRKTMSQALTEAFASVGSQNFEKEIARIQKDIIDDGIEELNRQWQDFRKTRLLRFGIYSLLTVPIEIGMYTGKSLAEVAALLTTWGAGILFAELRERKAEGKGLRAEPMYFIWRIKNKTRK